MEAFGPLLAYWVHDLDPFIFEINGIGPRWYGLAYVAGFALAWWLLGLYDRRGRGVVASADRELLFICLIVGVFLGGRLGLFILYQPETLLADPMAILRVWEGGMASHGAFVGVTAAVLFFAARRKIDPLRLGDAIVSVAPPGIFLGRLANFINGELWGRVTEAPWAVIFPRAQTPGHFDPEAPAVFVESLGQWANPRHPSQLYEAAGEGLILGLFIQWRFWTAGKRLPPGRLAAEFFIVYAIVRILGEIYRQPDAGLILGVSRGIFYSVLTLLAGVGLAVYTSRRAARKTA